MSPTDPRLHPALQSALVRVKAAAAAAADQTVDGLGIAALSAVGMRQRDAYLAAQFELGRRAALFKDRFNQVLTEKVVQEANRIASPAGTRPAPATDWQSLSLVEDDAVEELVSSERLGQTIAHECEWELRELATYMGSVLRTGRAEQDRNPLRPELIGKALFRAIESVSTERDTRTLLSRELARSLAKSMRACYRDIVEELRSRGIQPVGLTVKGVEGPGNELPRELLRQNSAYDTLSRDSGGLSRFDSRYEGSSSPEMLGLPSTGRSAGLGSASSAPAGLRADRRHGRHGHGATFGVIDSQMMALIRRLAFLGSRAGELDGIGTMPPGAGDGSARSTGGGPSTGGSLRGGGAWTGLMAANQIRAHGDELRRAASTPLDHRVIDVLGSLFDQILSDPKVPPQMARVIARLQLPMLRVALGDPSFFSSHRHPLRLLVNRIASMACAFDDLSEPPGLEFLERVRDLVQQIVEGDFDQMDLYEAKLLELEQFVAERTERDVQDRAQAATLLHDKESELRLQQRYMQTLTTGLAALSMPEFVREFLAQVWSQTIMRVVHRDGPKSEAAKRFRLAGRELVMSVQPKGSPTHRKQFLMKLPQLMKDLNEGLDLVGWPPAGRKRFFDQLMPAHAESLKGQPLSELSYNLLAAEIDAILARSIPDPQDAPRGEPIPELHDVALDHRFSPEEAARIGLLPEASIDWAGPVAPAAEPEPTADERDISIEGLPAATDVPEPLAGRALVDHMQIGFAYRMHVNDAWQKVRLSYISPGRAFFVFTRGKKHQETISLTTRMLTRLCETQRLRPYESAYLLERATARARSQLAQLGPTSRR